MAGIRLYHRLVGHRLPIDRWREQPRGQRRLVFRDAVAAGHDVLCLPAGRGNGVGVAPAGGAAGLCHLRHAHTRAAHQSPHDPGVVRDTQARGGRPAGCGQQQLPGSGDAGLVGGAVRRAWNRAGAIGDRFPYAAVGLAARDRHRAGLFSAQFGDDAV